MTEPLTPAQTAQLFGPLLVWKAGLGDGRALLLRRTAHCWQLEVVMDREAGHVTLGSLPLRSPDELDALMAALLSLAARMGMGTA